MPQEKTVTRPRRQETESVESHGDPPADGPSPLLQQAAEFAMVARQSLEDCQRGVEAEQELVRRRNRSGQ
jgi:hypothetical protein